MSPNLAALLHAQAAARPHHPALLDPAQPPITFAALQAAVNQGAALLRSTGLVAGDRVLVYQPISAHLYVALGALFQAGLTAVFIDPGMERTQLERAATLLAPRGFLATPRAHLLRLISPGIRRIPINFTTGKWPLPAARRWSNFAQEAQHGQPHSGSEQRNPTLTLPILGRESSILRRYGFLPKVGRAGFWCWQPCPRAANTKREGSQAREGFFSANASSPPEVADCTEEMPALITVTSGSTGTPKFAIRTHGFLRSQHQAIDASLAMPPDTIVATTLPIFVLSFLASGLTTLLSNVDLRRPGNVEIAPLLAQMQDTGVTALAASPAFLDQLARYCAHHKRTLPQIRQVFSGGAPVFVDLMDQMIASAPNATFRAVYGATEAEPITLLDHATIRAADRQHMANGGGLLVGETVPALEVRVIPDRWGHPHGPYSAQEWDEISQSAGGKGEIVVMGPHVLTTTGPGEDPALTKIAVGDQLWHRTGDAGTWDEQGRLWLLGRCAARIDGLSADGSPESLYPFTVETAAHTFPAVKHAALIADGGRRVLALELYTPQGDKWLTTLRQTLAWARLDEIRILPQLPVDKRHNAKIDYPELRRMLGVS